MDRSFDSHRERRQTFTRSVQAYADGRPGYPAAVFDLLTDVCGLGEGTRVLEIGPGTGQATEQLLAKGASVVAIELGQELADHLTQAMLGDLEVIVGAFEEVTVEPSSFDLIVAATSFHWVPPAEAVDQCAEILRPGGWLALWWTVFGDSKRPDPFHDAIQPLITRYAPELREHAMACDARTGAHPHGLDSAARMADIDASGVFGPVRHQVLSWTGVHSAVEIRNLFASFSPWIALRADCREPLLDGLYDLALTEFDDRVERPYLTPIYLAQRN